MSQGDAIVYTSSSKVLLHEGLILILSQSTCVIRFCVSEPIRGGTVMSLINIYIITPPTLQVATVNIQITLITIVLQWAPSTYTL